jgi:hypothetical protein
MRCASAVVGSPGGRRLTFEECGIVPGRLPSATSVAIAEAAFDAHICEWGPGECEICRVRGERRFVTRRQVIARP